MKQLILQDFEKKRLHELYEWNSVNSGVICDFDLAKKLKEVIKDGERRIL